MTLQSSVNHASLADCSTVPQLEGSPSVEAVWERSSRYADQPMSFQTRLFGMGGVALVALLILGGVLFTWKTYQVAQTSPALSVFDVAPPATPPDPVSEMPPDPEEKQEQQKPQPDADAPKIKPPELKLPSVNPIPISVPTLPVDPGKPVETNTAPETKPLPPAQQLSTGKPTWEGLVLGALNKVKRYPREAMFRRQQGVPWIRFAMDRNGKVLSVALDRSSGSAALDAEAIALPKRAQPLPKPPRDVPGERIELVVPVEFFLR